MSEWEKLTCGLSQERHCLIVSLYPTPRLLPSPATLEEIQPSPTQLCLIITHSVVLVLKALLLGEVKYIPNKM